MGIVISAGASVSVPLYSTRASLARRQGSKQGLWEIFWSETPRMDGSVHIQKAKNTPGFNQIFLARRCGGC